MKRIICFAAGYLTVLAAILSCRLSADLNICCAAQAIGIRETCGTSALHYQETAARQSMDTFRPEKEGVLTLRRIFDDSIFQPAAYTGGEPFPGTVEIPERSIY